MAEILSQSQIDMLLSNLLGNNSDSPEEAEPAAPTSGADTAGADQVQQVQQDMANKKIKEYDFRSPKLFTREQLKLLYTIYENYARIVSSHMTAKLQTYTLVEIVEVEEQQYYEYNNALPDSVLVGLIDFYAKDEEESDDSQVIMEMSKDLGFCAIDRFLGGVGQPLEEDREYTEIEISLLGHLFKGMIALIKNAWADHLELFPKLIKMETNSRILQGISPDENVVIVVMMVTLNETQGKLTLCIPASTLSAMFKSREAQSKRKERRGSQEEENLRRERIMYQINESDLEIRGILGEVTVLSRDVVELQVGDIIMLNKPEDAYVDVAVEKTVWFKGDLGVHNKKKAILIQEKLKKGSEPAI